MNKHTRRTGMALLALLPLLPSVAHADETTEEPLAQDVLIEAADVAVSPETPIAQVENLPEPVSASPAARTLSPYEIVDQAIAALGMQWAAARIHKICARESGYRPGVYGDNGRAGGLFQFHWGTWVYGCNLLGVWPGNNSVDMRTNADQNARVAINLMKRGEWSHWVATDPVVRGWNW